MKPPVLAELRDASLLFGSPPTPALTGASLLIRRGEGVAITGRSGSGKSSLLELLGGLRRPSSGIVVIDGQRTDGLPDRELARMRGRVIGFVFQRSPLVAGMPLIENVAEGLRYQGVGRGERTRRAAEALDRVGLDRWRRHRPHELSGGQRQRAAIARALVGRPSLLLADEPTGSLDERTAADILTLLRSLVDDGTAVVTVTHDPAVAAGFSRRLRVSEGRLDPEVRS